jgi:hypothetical protein
MTHPPQTHPAAAESSHAAAPFSAAQRLRIGGRDIAVDPVTVRDLPAFLAAVEPIARELMAGDVMAALAHNADRLIQAVCTGARVERAWLDDQQADVLVELAVAVIEVNADFFARRVLPAVTQAAQTLSRMDGTTGSGGTAGLPGSLAQASPTLM